MTSRTGSKGFTLVEVLLAVCVMAMGTLVIEEGLLRSARVAGRYFDETRLGAWMDEKIWQARQAVAYETEPSPMRQSGDVPIGGKVYHWSLETSSVPLGKDLYSIDLRVWWGEGARPSVIERTALVSRYGKADLEAG